MASDLPLGVPGPQPPNTPGGPLLGGPVTPVIVMVNGGSNPEQQRQADLYARQQIGRPPGR